MYDLSKIKATIARDPLPFLTTLYGDTVKRSGNDWRVGSKGGRSFDTRKGELLCVTFNGDAGQGDCFEVWKSHYDCDFPTAVAQIANLYGLRDGGLTAPAVQIQRQARPDPDARLTEPPKPWPIVREPYATLWHASVLNLMANPSAQAAISEWRGWPIPMVKRLATGLVLGLFDFDCWPDSISFQPAAFFRVLHPELHRDSAGACFWHWHHVQLHVRFRSGATRRDKRPLSWIYVPTMKEIAVDDGAHAPLVLASFGRDPEQPGYGTHCECIIVCAGEWDAITIVVLMDWIDETGMLTVPKGLAVIGIRSEGRGGTDAFLRWYHHWHPRSAILLADADATGSSWFESTDRRSCFAEQLERRGMLVLAKAPRLQEGVKDVNDLYRAGLLHRSHIDEILGEAGFTTKGGLQ